MTLPGKPIAVLLLSMHLLAACDSAKVLSMEQTTTLLKGPIQIGTSREEVISQLGEPYKQERHGTTEFLFYQTIWQAADKAAARNPIAVLDGKVVGLGKAQYEKFVRDETGEGEELDKQRWNSNTDTQSPPKEAPASQSEIEKSAGPIKASGARVE